jgi:hypothetical protein
VVCGPAGPVPGGNIEPIFRRADKQTCTRLPGTGEIYFLRFILWFFFFILIYILFNVAWLCFLSFGGGSKFKQVFLET